MANYQNISFSITYVQVQGISHFPYLLEEHEASPSNILLSLSLALASLHSMSQSCYYLFFQNILVTSLINTVRAFYLRLTNLVICLHSATKKYYFALLNF
jgi:hypothetical protein